MHATQGHSGVSKTGKAEKTNVDISFLHKTFTILDVTYLRIRISFTTPIQRVIRTFLDLFLFFLVMHLFIICF